MNYLKSPNQGSSMLLQMLFPLMLSPANLIGDELRLLLRKFKCYPLWVLLLYILYVHRPLQSQADLRHLLLGPHCMQLTITLHGNCPTTKPWRTRAYVSTCVTLLNKYLLNEWMAKWMKKAFSFLLYPNNHLRANSMMLVAVPKFSYQRGPIFTPSTGPINTYWTNKTPLEVVYHGGLLQQIHYSMNLKEEILME